MTQGTSPERIAPPQLDYAPQPTVGDVSLTRADGVTIVTRRPSARRIAAAFWPLVNVLSPIAGIAICSPFFRVPMSGTSMAIGSGIAALFGLMAAVPRLVFACHPIRWTVTTEGIAVDVRRTSQVIHEVYARATIADVRVERVRLQKQTFKRLALVAVDPLGGRRIHAYGRRAELTFIAEAFRDGLGIGSDPMRELGFSPVPRWGMATRQIGVANVAVTLRTPRPLVDITASVLVIAGIGALVTTLERTAGEATWGTALAAGAASAGGAIFFVAGTYLLILRLRRRVSVAVNPSSVILTEQTLIRPARENWPADRVGGFRVDRSGRRANLWLDFVDGSSAKLVRAGPAADVQFMRDSLVAALERNQTPRPVAAAK